MKNKKIINDYEVTDSIFNLFISAHRFAFVLINFETIVKQWDQQANGEDLLIFTNCN
jgi:hypothetical protein